MRKRNEVFCRTDGRLTWHSVSDLFDENDRLRRRVAELEAEKAAFSEEVAFFRRQLDLATTQAGSPLIRAARGDAGPCPH